MPATTLGRYQIVRELARSNDIVYEARDPSNNQRVAVKELQIPANLVGVGRQERIARFTREARAAAALSHPNIVRILDHNKDGDRYYIAMEFLEGQSLRDVLRSRGQLPVGEAIRIARAVAEGLVFAHQKGVVHRDIKPDNVHLEPGGRVVITDFGIARLTFEATLTADGQIFGTPSYMAPEQIQGATIDARTDLFSLGVMLYEMVSGRKPFVGDSVVTITYNIIHADPPSLPGAGAQLDAVVRCLMAKDPAYRYQSANDLIQDLQEVAAGRSPTRARRPPPPTPPRPTAAPSTVRPAPPVSPPVPAPYPGPMAPSIPSRPPIPLPPRALGYPGGPAATVPRSSLPMAPVPAAGPRIGGAGPANMPTAGVQYGPGGYIGSGTIPAHALPQRRNRGGGSGAKVANVLGWFAVIVVVAGLILLITWAGVTAQDRVQKTGQLRVSAEMQARAKSEYDAGRFDRALTLYEKAATEGLPESRNQARRGAAISANQLAQRANANGRYETAAKYAERAVRHDPNYASAYVEWGRSLAELGQVDRALEVYDGAAGAAARLEKTTTRSEDLAIARAAATSAAEWKVKAVYDDVDRQLRQGNRGLAEKRLQQVMELAPGTNWARNAEIRLRQFRSTATANPAASLPADPSDFSGNGANPTLRALPSNPGGQVTMPSAGSTSSTSPPPGSGVPPLPPGPRPAPGAGQDATPPPGWGPRDYLRNFGR